MVIVVQGSLHTIFSYVSSVEERFSNANGTYVMSKLCRENPANISEFLSTCVKYYLKKSAPLYLTFGQTRCIHSNETYRFNNFSDTNGGKRD